METISISKQEADRILNMQEGHFCDMKSKEISPARLTKSLSAFANAEGGELFIGIEEIEPQRWKWNGFADLEDANGHVQILEELFPLGGEFNYSFLTCEELSGYILKAEVKKTASIKYDTKGRAYIRRGPQSLPVSTDEALERLRRNKGIDSFESETVNVATDLISNSETIISFVLNVVPNAEPEPWLKKQQLIVRGLPTVGGVVLYADEPQAILPKRCGIKLYRYKTADEEGSRETLDFDPISIEGSAYTCIYRAVEKTTHIIESLRIRTPGGLKSIRYPSEALHEIITNAVLHRDYSIADDVHIKIFDNRIEVKSPGTLPGHITPNNILHERFARNGSIVRLINKFENPPNKDVGEGLNTAFNAMREMKLKDPVVIQSEGHVVVILRHESLATPEEQILEYLDTHDSIANREAREICHIGSENKMKTVLQRMVRDDLIERVPNTTRYNAAYRLKGDTSPQPLPLFDQEEDS